MTVSQDSIDG